MDLDDSYKATRDKYDRLNWPTTKRGHVMREFYSVFLPLGVVVFLLVYVFLINPDALHELGRWLQNSQFGRLLDNFF
jgi:hypothetical protein